MKKIFALVAFAILFAGIGAYFGLKRTEPAAPAATAVGALMQLSFADADGKERKMSEWQGKVILLNFWATWCPPCVSEMPELVELQNDFAGKNLQVVGIAIDSRSKVQEFALKHSIRYPLLIGGMEGTAVSKEFGNDTGGLPFTVLIAPDGTVRKTYMGRLDMQTVRADLGAL